MTTPKHRPRPLTTPKLSWVPVVEDGKRTIKLLDADEAELVRRRNTLPAGTPFVFGYCRLSTRFQAERHNTIEAQQQGISRWYDHHLKGKTEWGGFVCDPATSATKPFLKRKGGEALHRKLRRGDHVIVMDVGRGFRSTLDMLKTMELWEKKGIQLHLANFDVDIASPLGRVVIQMLATFYQLERDTISNRLNGGRKRMFEEGYWPPGKMGCGDYFTPYGYKGSRGYYRGKLACKLAPWPEQRAVGVQILELMKQGLDTTTIAKMLPPFEGRKWLAPRVQRWAESEKRLQEMERRQEMDRKKLEEQS